MHKYSRPYPVRPEPPSTRLRTGFDKLRTGYAERSRRMSGTLTPCHCPLGGEGQEREMHGPSSAGCPLTLSLCGALINQGSTSHSQQGYMQVRPALAMLQSVKGTMGH